MGKKIESLTGEMPIPRPLHPLPRDLSSIAQFCLEERLPAFGGEVRRWFGDKFRENLGVAQEAEHGERQGNCESPGLKPARRRKADRFFESRRFPAPHRSCQGRALGSPGMKFAGCPVDIIPP